jgi:hypothetical protein
MEYRKLCKMGLPTVELVPGKPRHPEVAVDKWVRRRFGGSAVTAPADTAAPVDVSIKPKPHIIVDVAKNIVEVDQVRHSVDHFACLVVDQLVKANGNWLSRADMQENEPRLKRKQRIDRIIKIQLKRDCSAVGSLIESDKAKKRGYRIIPSIFT